MTRNAACARRGGLALAAVALLPLAACSSLRAARLYDSGTRALDRGDSAGAVERLERAVGLAPHASQAWNHLGLAYAAAGREVEAELAFRRALDLDCDNRAAGENLRAWRARAGDTAGFGSEAR